MGYDISYHPIKEDEIKKWYFDAMKDESLIDKLSDEFNIENFYKDKYKETLFVAQDTEPTEPFEKTHGYYIAIVQGYFRTYFYLRGAAFSFLIDENSEYLAYTKTWEEILPEKVSNPIKNKIYENYSSGVYIPANMVEKLLADYASDPKIEGDLDQFFSNGQIAVFLKALKYARDHKTGLLEATEVIEPNPLDLNKSVSYSNLFNCDKEGVHLYEDTALAQIREIEEANKMKVGEIRDNVIYDQIEVDTPTPPVKKEKEKEKEKKGFWKRLFGG